MIAGNEPAFPAWMTERKWFAGNLAPMVLRGIVADGATDEQVAAEVARITFIFADAIIAEGEKL